MNELKVSLLVQCVCVDLILILCLLVMYLSSEMDYEYCGQPVNICSEAVDSSSLVPLLGIPLSGRGCCLATGIQTLFHFSLIFFHWLSARAET